MRTYLSDKAQELSSFYRPNLYGYKPSQKAHPPPSISVHQQSSSTSGISQPSKQLLERLNKLQIDTNNDFFETCAKLNFSTPRNQNPKKAPPSSCSKFFIPRRFALFPQPKKVTFTDTTLHPVPPSSYAYIRPRYSDVPSSALSLTTGQSFALELTQKRTQRKVSLFASLFLEDGAHSKAALPSPKISPVRAHMQPSAVPPPSLSPSLYTASHLLHRRQGLSTLGLQHMSPRVAAIASSAPSLDAVLAGVSLSPPPSPPSHSPCSPSPPSERSLSPAPAWLSYYQTLLPPQAGETVESESTPVADSGTHSPTTSPNAQCPWQIQPRTFGSVVSSR